MCVCVLAGAGVGKGNKDQGDHVHDGSKAVDPVEHVVCQAVHLPHDLCHHLQYST